MTLETELAKLKELEAKATPGPWVLVGSGNIPEINYWDAKWREHPSNDERFLAEMRNALPKLLKTIEIQREIIRAFRKSVNSKQSWDAQEFSDHKNDEIEKLWNP